MENVTIDPKLLREECLNYGLFLRVIFDLFEKDGIELTPKRKEGAMLLAFYFLYSQALPSPSTILYYACLGYEQRRYEDEKGNKKEFPAWGEEEETDSQRFADAFFPVYCLFLSKQGGEPSDYLGPLFFFSGAIREDIEEALGKRKGDPHYDAFYTEITSYPFSLTLKESAERMYDLSHESVDN